ncbi:DUF6607 family protein [Hyalangium versicolor]|uniref:DUF6607 family protein n=1 Tax=Hyalangium versicolor TaxID=2861190 RepID=UPI001CCDBF9F|nr:DUF6607 family protein [Hyalangium versicolor]
MSSSGVPSRFGGRVPLQPLTLPALALVMACASRQDTGTGGGGKLEAAACDPARDKAAILQMAGTYQVDFAFEETVSLSEGYTPHEPYRTTGTEQVSVVEDTPRSVTLQHILVVEKNGKREALKHWRQDWTFEDTELLEFRGHRTWERHTLSPEAVKCTWSQAVFEVDDGPRYEGYGRWTHERGLSAWESAETWRPLPRREYTKRSDYDVLVGTNRHALTPKGWVHEQDSLKVVLGPTPHALVRERGLNQYTRQSAEPNLPEASAYWKESQGFWAEVRQEWQAVFQEHPQFTLRETVDGKPRSQYLFGLAEEHAKSAQEGHAPPAPEARQQIRAALERFVETAVSQRSERSPDGT